MRPPSTKPAPPAAFRAILPPGEDMPMLDPDLPVDQLADAYRQWRETRGMSPEPFLDLMSDDIEMRSVLEP